MTVYERFAELLQKKGVRVADVTRATQIKSTVFSEWKKGKAQPKADKLQKIADYFGVSMDYLLTGQEPEATWDGPSDLPAFTIGELQLLEIYKQLSEEKQADMIKFGQFLLSRQAEERKKTTELSKEA